MVLPVSDIPLFRNCEQLSTYENMLLMVGYGYDRLFVISVSWQSSGSKLDSP